MSDTPIDSSWWLAADGKWYPPTFRPGGVAASEDGDVGPPVRPEPPGLPADSQAVARELATLPADFHIVHGFGRGSRRYVVNHLVIGPTGARVIIASNEPGALVKQAGTLWNGGASISPEIEQVEALTRFARKVLGCDVDPVLCFTQASLPRPAQMIGRVRVVELAALADHLAAGSTTMSPDQIERAMDRVDDWLRQAPTVTAGPAPVSRSATVRRRVGIGAAVVATLATATIGASFLTDVSVAKTDSTRPTTTTAVTTTTTASTVDGLLSVDISCPRLGLGYQLIPLPVSTGLDLLQVAATVEGQPMFIGPLSAGQPGPPIMGVPPSSTVGFDYVVVGAHDDDVLPPPTHLDIATPPWPC